LRSECLQALLTDFAAFLDSEPSPAARRRWADVGAREGACKFAVRERKRLRKLARRTDEAPDPERMHTLRIRCKRFRYLLECFEPIANGLLRGYVQIVRRLQDALGEYQDARVAMRRISEELALLGDAATGEAQTAPLLEMSRAREQDAVAARRRFDKEWQLFERRVTKKNLRKLFD
jgi:CHAD domain-containing protein